MAINGIQFQKGLSLAQFMKDYGTEAECEAALIQARWPRGFACPKCAHGVAYEFRRSGRRYWQCKGCNYQCTLRAGTIMEHSQLPLTKWYLAIHFDDPVEDEYRGTGDEAPVGHYVESSLAA